MFTTIVRIRWYERTMVDKMISDPKYRGYNHFYAGQEAVATGVCAALNNKGAVRPGRPGLQHAPADRPRDRQGHGHEEDGRGKRIQATGINSGYAGEMHISDTTIGFIGADGMIGPGPVIATGSAFAIRARGSKQVVVNFGGDGTYATPHFHSALNNAALLKLPFIYVLENNLYHQYAHYSYSCPMKDIADAARTYRIPGVVVDGQDVFQVYNAAKTAVDRARAGEGPTLIEAKTYRYYNHWGAPGAKPGELGAFGYDPLAISSFRPEREVREWMQRDPVDICRNTLINWGVLTRARADEIEAAAKKEAIEAFAWADAAAVLQAGRRLEERVRRGRPSPPVNSVDAQGENHGTQKLDVLGPRGRAVRDAPGQEHDLDLRADPAGRLHARQARDQPRKGVRPQARGQHRHRRELDGLVRRWAPAWPAPRRSPTFPTRATACASR